MNFNDLHLINISVFSLNRINKTFQIVFINLCSIQGTDLFISAYLFAYCYHQIIDFLLNTLSDYNIHSSAQNIRMFSTHTMILITISIVMCKTLNAMTHEIVLIIISIVITQIIGYFYSNNHFDHNIHCQSLVIFIPTIVSCFIGMECYSMW